MNVFLSPSFRFDSVCLAPDRQIGRHQHDAWELSYISIGKGIRTIGDTREPFQAGEVILLPPGIPHCWEFDPEEVDGCGHIANITCSFTNELLDRCMSAFPSWQKTVEYLRMRREAIRYSRDAANAIAALLQMMEAQDEAHRAASFLGLLLMLPGNGCESVVGRPLAADKMQARLEQVRVYAICNAARPISIDDVARHVGMNRAAFCVFFKKTTGKTFVTWLNELRLERACRLLEEGRLSVGEICYQAGFNNVPYFNRLFKRIKGTAPSRWAHEQAEVGSGR